MARSLQMVCGEVLRGAKDAPLRMTGFSLVRLPNKAAAPNVPRPL